MERGNFDMERGDITGYVTRLYNEVKYLDPAIEFSSFV